MSRNILNLLPNAVGQGQLNIVYAEVAPPAPTRFSDPLFVYLVDWTNDFSVRVDGWSADHGSVLPAVGAPCLLVKDSRENWRVAWWNSPSTAFAPTGTAGGDLTGSTYPNPIVAKVLGGQTPLAIDDTGKSLALQLLSTQQLQLDFGTDTFTFAASQVSNTRTISHGLGRTPQIVLLTIAGGFGVTAAVTPYYSGRTTTQFQANAVANVAITATPTYNWIAVG